MLLVISLFIKFSQKNQVDSVVFWALTVTSLLVTKDVLFMLFSIIYSREALVPAAEMVSLAPPETPAPLDLQDLMDLLALVE